MIEQTRKLRLDELKVDSFVTKFDTQETDQTNDFKGGSRAIDDCLIRRYNTRDIHCATQVLNWCRGTENCFYESDACPVSNEGGSICVCTLDAEFFC